MCLFVVVRLRYLKILFLLLLLILLLILLLLLSTKMIIVNYITWLWLLSNRLLLKSYQRYTSSRLCVGSGFFVRVLNVLCALVLRLRVVCVVGCRWLSNARPSLISPRPLSPRPPVGCALGSFPP